MPAALVKLLGQKGLFGVSKDDERARVHPQDKRCMLVDAGKVINLKDNTELEDTIINANQTVLIKPAMELRPSRYHALVSHNPQLSLSGAVVSPVTSVVRPGEEDMVGLIIRASKKLDLSELTHVFELYQID